MPRGGHNKGERRPGCQHGPAACVLCLRAREVARRWIEANPDYHRTRRDRMKNRR